MTVCDLILPILKKEKTIFDPNAKKEEVEVICASLALSVLLNNLMKVYFDKSFLDKLHSDLGVYTDALRDVLNRNKEAKCFIRDEIDSGRAYNLFIEGAKDKNISPELIKKIPKCMPDFCRGSLELIFHPEPMVETDIDNIYAHIRKH